MLTRTKISSVVLHTGLVLLAAAALTAQGPPGGVGGDGTAKAWRTQLDLSFSGSSGNSSLATLQTAVAVRRLETERIEFQASLSYRYGKSEERVVANLLRAELRFDIFPQATWSPFLFASATRNPVRRLKLRSNVGAGGKYTLWRGERGRSSLNFAAIFNFEDFEVVEEGAPPPTERTLRWSARYRLNLNLGSGNTLEHNTLYQPVWDVPGDYYLIMASTLETEIFGSLSLMLKHEYQHDDSPPEGVVRDDQFVSVGFRYVF